MKYVSVIMPCRNEALYIKDCIASLFQQDYPKEYMEFLIVDGLSQDGTRNIIQDYQKKYSYIRLLDNHQKNTPAALNIGIKNSKGEIIIRLDCHATYERDYISKCVEYLGKYQADNIGGIMKTVPTQNTLEAKSIALCLSNGLGVGNSIFRSGSNTARQVDTVFGGCYRKEVFSRIGLFNEKLVRSQDMEFNLRLTRAGGKIMLVPDIISYYHPKPTFLEFFKHTFNDGVWSILPLKLSGTVLKPRHYLPTIGAFVFMLLVLFTTVSLAAQSLLFLAVILYMLIVFLSSLRISIKEKDIRYLFFMPIAFGIRHMAYGFGGLWGVVRLLFI